MKKTLKVLLILLLTLWSIGGICLNIKVGQSFLQMLTPVNNHYNILLFKNSEALLGNYSGLNVVWLILFISIYMLINKAIQIKEKRLIIFSISLATLLSIFQLIGQIITFYISVNVLFLYWIISLIKLIGLIITYSVCFIVLFSKLAQYKEEKDVVEYNFFTSNLKSFFIIAILIFIFWIPYLLKEFPGSLNTDAIYQIEQSIGVVHLDSWHPVIHTLLIKMCITIGNAIFNSLNAGVAIYSILQMLCMSMIFSYSIYYMAKKGFSIRTRLISLLYFTFCPTFPIMGLTMGKDVIFAGLMILLTIMLIELMTNTEKFFNSKAKLIFFTIIMIIISLFRINAIYMIILLIPFIFFIKNGYRIKISSLFMVSIVLVFTINFVINNIFNVPIINKLGLNSKVVKYSLLTQQITRVMVDHNEEISEDDKNRISKFFPNEDFYTNYIEFLQDPMMGQINQDYLLENQGEFIKLWFNLLLKYPDSFFNGFFCLTSGYYDSESNRVSIWPGIVPNNLGIEVKPIYSSYIVTFVESFIYNQNMPIISFIFNLGFVCWIVLILLIFNLYKRNYNFSFVFLPLLLYLFTVFFGPLNMDYRYVLYEFVCLPILIGYTINMEDEKNKKNNQLKLGERNE